MKIFRRLGLFSEIILILLIGINESLAYDQLPDDMVKMKAVKDKILRGYDKDVRPRKEGSNATKVKSKLVPRQIIDVDEEKGLFILDSLFWMSWEDPRLKWDLTTEYSSLFIQLPPDLLWTPDISVRNSHTLHLNPFASQEDLIRIQNNGTVGWVPPLHSQTFCSVMNESTYPYDEVECEVILGSWAHHGWEIDFSHDDELYLGYFRNVNPRWELLVSKAKFRREEFFFKNDTEMYLSLTAVFPIKRRPLPEVEATRSPCILVMLLTLSIFWLPTESSKKVQLGGILLLVLTILLVYVAFSTQNPLRVAMAVSSLHSTMYILVTTLLLQILIIFKLCKFSGPVRPPAALMQLLRGSFGANACLRWLFSYDNTPTDKVQLKENSPENSESPTPQDDWTLVAAALDKLFFVIMSIAMICVHHL